MYGMMGGVWDDGRVYGMMGGVWDDGGCMG